MESRHAIGVALDRLFRLDEWEADPAFRRFIPMATQVGGACRIQEAAQPGDRPLM